MFQQVLIAFNQLGRKPALGQMPSPMVALVEVNRVSRHQPSQALAQIAAGRPQQQMKVVGHETDQKQADRIKPFWLGQLR
jgi:hypothetical protein